MIKLSYTSLNNVYNGHEWLNKQMGIPVPDYPFLREGKEAHRLIQRHVSGAEIHPYLKDVTAIFPVVEKHDFDRDCMFSVKFVTPRNEYEFIGYVDGYDPEKKILLEIKTSSVNWSISQFRDAIQRKIYAYAFPDFKEAYLITGSKDPEKWKSNPPKLFGMPLTNQDRDEAFAWINGGIERLEKGDFSGGLDENGICTGCFWNMDRYKNIANCHFM